MLNFAVLAIDSILIKIGLSMLLMIAPPNPMVITSRTRRTCRWALPSPNDRRPYGHYVPRTNEERGEYFAWKEPFFIFFILRCIAIHIPLYFTFLPLPSPLRLKSISIRTLVQPPCLAQVPIRAVFQAAAPFCDDIYDSPTLPVTVVQ